MSFNTPILFLIFNRPDETALSFEAIKMVKPRQLFIAADGARTHILEDLEKCKATRNLVLEGIDWDCEVKTLFRNENLGCGVAVQNALDWFFDEVEMGIIIEDDIVPVLSFFNYTELLLQKFKDNNKIFSINGYSLAYENNNYDYGLTRYFNMWGWATWRRSNVLVRKTWANYDGNNDFKKGSKLFNAISLPTILPHNEWFNLWRYLFDSTQSGKLDTWDYQWVYTCLKNQNYCVRPNWIMINNIGFNENSTHTNTTPHAMLQNIEVNTSKIIGFNLKGKMRVDNKYEIVNVAEYWNRIVINYSIFLKKWKKKFKQKINKFIDIY